MVTAWRIVKRRYADSAFDGEGARRYGGRWNSPGTALVYASESRALALLEVLVGIRTTGTLSAYLLFPVRFDETLVETLPAGDLPDDWRRSPPPASTQRIGDTFVAEQRAAVLRVPSVVVPAESNFLLDPAHPEFGRIHPDDPEDVTVDPRLLAPRDR